MAAHFDPRLRKAYVELKRSLAGVVVSETSVEDHHRVGLGVAAHPDLALLPIERVLLKVHVAHGRQQALYEEAAKMQRRDSTRSWII